MQSGFEGCVKEDPDPCHDFIKFELEGQEIEATALSSQTISTRIMLIKRLDCLHFIFQMSSVACQYKDQVINEVRQLTSVTVLLWSGWCCIRSLSQEHWV